MLLAGDVLIRSGLGERWPALGPLPFGTNRGLAAFMRIDVESLITCLRDLNEILCCPVFSGFHFL